MRFSLHVSPKLDFLFIESPKVGCSTLKELIFTLLRPDAPLPESVHDRAQLPTWTIDQVSKEVLTKILLDEHVFRFAFVREPMDRLVSLYYSGIVRGDGVKLDVMRRLGRAPEDDLSIDDFLLATCDIDVDDMDWHCRPQHIQILHGLVELSFLGRYETFEADARHVASILAPGRSIVLPHRNRGASRDSLPSRKAREAVWAKYEADYRAFGYPFL